VIPSPRETSPDQYDINNYSVPIIDVTPVNEHKFVDQANQSTVIVPSGNDHGVTNVPSNIVASGSELGVSGYGARRGGKMSAYRLKKKGMRDQEYGKFGVVQNRGKLRSGYGQDVDESFQSFGNSESFTNRYIANDPSQM